MKLLIKNGHVVDPANNLDGAWDVLIEGTKITKVAANIKNGADKIIDAAGMIVIPGIVDMHVHLREPGQENKETVASGTAAALKGGVTSLLSMPNTLPAIDSTEHIKLLKGIIEKTAKVKVYIAGAITKDREGETLTDFAKLKKEGALAITDDGASVDNDALMLEAFKKAKKAGILVVCHCEDKSLSGKGMVNRGIIATRMGLRGISNESEYLRIERDIALAAKADAVVHIAHVSCKESVELIAKAKLKGVRVTAETCPHYFTFTEEAVLGYDTNFKMNPPLRSSADRQAIREGLSRGIIDVISSDHAPHTENEKDIEFDRAEFGVIGLETELAATITELIDKKVLDWPALVRALCVNPAKVLGIDKGTLGAGKDADIVIVDPHKEWLVAKEDFLSRSKNSPFIEKKLKGVVQYTLYNGRVLYREATKG